MLATLGLSGEDSLTESITHRLSTCCTVAVSTCSLVSTSPWMPTCRSQACSTRGQHHTALKSFGWLRVVRRHVANRKPQAMSLYRESTAQGSLLCSACVSRSRHYMSLLKEQDGDRIPKGAVLHERPVPLPFMLSHCVEGDRSRFCLSRPARRSRRVLKLTALSIPIRAA